MPDPSRGEVWLVNVKAKSFIKCEDVRSVAKERLSRRWGKVSGGTLAAVEDRLRILLGL